MNEWDALLADLESRVQSEGDRWIPLLHLAQDLSRCSIRSRIRPREMSDGFEVAPVELPPTYRRPSGPSVSFSATGDFDKIRVLLQVFTVHVLEYCTAGNLLEVALELTRRMLNLPTVVCEELPGWCAIPSLGADPS